MDSFNADIAVAIATIVQTLFVVAVGIYLLGPQRKEVQANTGSSNAAAELDEMGMMKIFQGEQRAQVAEMRTELANEKRKRIENDIAYVRVQRELETKLSEALQRNEEMGKELASIREEMATRDKAHETQIADLKAKLGTMSVELKTEREARRKLQGENEALRKRVRTLEGKDKVEKQ